MVFFLDENHIANLRRIGCKVPPARENMACGKAAANSPHTDVFTQTLKLILTLEGRKPASSLPGALNALFLRLADPALANAADVEDAIWALWHEHREPAAVEVMERAIVALGRKQYDVAETRLTALVELHPDYAETWNKRATLLFLLERDEESLADIARTLQLEPRHFGAICGFGQVCLRRGERAGALAAFEAALRINPHLAGIRDAAEKLRDGFAGRLH
jgi:tetratricopeptide (TPR) repeat protein